MKRLLAMRFLLLVPLCWLLPEPAPELLASVVTTYEEDAPGARPVAAVQARVEQHGGAVRLRLSVAAVGDGVLPLPGFDGLPGANLRTAEELERLLADGALRLWTRADGPRRVAAARPEVHRGPLPRRIVDAEGRLATGVSAAKWPLVVTFVSDPLPAGTSRSWLDADGLPRLGVLLQHDGHQAKIVAIESLPATSGEGW